MDLFGFVTPSAKIITLLMIKLYIIAFSLWVVLCSHGITKGRKHTPNAEPYALFVLMHVCVQSQVNQKSIYENLYLMCLKERQEAPAVAVSDRCPVSNVMVIMLTSKPWEAMHFTGEHS